MREDWLRSIDWNHCKSLAGCLVLSLRNKLLTGVAVAVPLVVTLWVLNLAYRFIKGISDPWISRIVLREAAPAEGIARLTLSDVPGVSFFVTLLMLVLLGVMATNVFGKRIISAFEKFLQRLPVVATIYNGVKQVIDSIRQFNRGVSFKRVVYVEYPSPGCRLIGFVTGQYIESIQSKNVTSVFIPTAPNPMTGFVIVVDSERVTDSGLGLDEASKLILSAGLVGPQGERGSDNRTADGVAVTASHQG